MVIRTNMFTKKFRNARLVRLVVATALFVLSNGDEIRQVAIPRRLKKNAKKSSSPKTTKSTKRKREKKLKKQSADTFFQGAFPVLIPDTIQSEEQLRQIEDEIQTMVETILANGDSASTKASKSTKNSITHNHCWAVEYPGLSPGAANCDEREGFYWLNYPYLVAYYNDHEGCEIDVPMASGDATDAIFLVASNGSIETGNKNDFEAYCPLDNNDGVQNDIWDDIERCEVATHESRCSYEYLSQNLPSDKTSWFVVTEGDTACLDRDSKYGFQLFLPPENPEDPTKLMVYFSGGGACFDWSTCLGLTNFVVYREVEPQDGGYFNYNLVENPLKSGGWATLSLSFCSGDMHVGNSEVELNNGLPWPFRSTEIVKFSGYNNTMSVISWIKEQGEFEKGSVEVAVGGSSAGGLGAQAWTKYLIEHLGASLVQSDAFIGMLPPVGNQILQLWNACATLERVGGSQELVDRCYCESGENCLHTNPPIFEEFLTEYPDVRVGYTGSKFDNLQCIFNALIASTFGDEWSVPAFLRCQGALPAFHEDSLGGWASVGNSVSSFLTETTQHVYTPEDTTFTTDVFGSEGDLTMAEYLEIFLNNPNAI